MFRSETTVLSQSMLWWATGCQAAHTTSQLQVLAPCPFEEGPSPSSEAWFPFAHAPPCNPSSSHTSVEVHLGLSSSSPPKQRAWSTPSPPKVLACCFVNTNLSSCFSTTVQTSVALAGKKTLMVNLSRNILALHTCCYG